MLLHNQRKGTLRWEAAGTVYEWEPYGDCEVPDKFLPHLRAQGFPVDVSPVPPESKAKQAFDEERALREQSEIRKLQERLAEAEARAAEACRAAEAAEIRAERSGEVLDTAEAKLKAVTDENHRLKSDAETYEKMLAEANAKVEQLEKQRAQASAEKKQQQQTRR